MENRVDVSERIFKRGLVAITAPCDVTDCVGAAIIGAVARNFSSLWCMVCR